MSKFDLEKRRDELLLATLPHVVFDGWRWQAVQAGARDLGMAPEEALDLFPNGAREVLVHFSRWADRRMLQELEKQPLGEMRVRDRIALAVRTRLEILAPYREAVRRGMSAFVLPGNAPRGLGCLYRSVDAMWYAAGDTSTDYNFYTKRLLLSGVLSSTVVYWLDDNSEDFQRTWAFLDRRISDVMRIGGTLGQTMKAALDLPDRLINGLMRGPRRPTRRSG